MGAYKIYAQYYEPNQLEEPEKYNEGFYLSIPTIKNVSFKDKTRMEVLLRDGRKIFVPLSEFPAIERMSKKQRKRRHIYKDFFYWDSTSFTCYVANLFGITLD